MIRVFKYRTTSARTNKEVIFFFGGLIIGAVLTVLVVNPAALRRQGEGEELRDKGNFVFINPLLECEIGDQVIARGLIPFSDALSDHVEKISSDSSLNDIAVYYRDLNNGPWAGIHEKDNFFPASLLKVPVMIALFKGEETEPPILSQKLTFEKKFEDPLNRVQTFAPKEEIQIGRTYTVEELIERMIIYSDNQAMRLLLSKLDQRWLELVYERLGIDSNIIKPDNPHTGTISVKEYSGFFRILYNASFLSKEHSEKALEILSRSDFQEGLVAGIPASMTIAHKFGEAGSMESFRQLHDCGIIYHPNRPYLICVMTRGTDINVMKKTIEGISRFVFNELEMGLRAVP